MNCVAEVGERCPYLVFGRAVWRVGGRVCFVLGRAADQHEEGEDYTAERHGGHDAPSVLTGYRGARCGREADLVWRFRSVVGHGSGWW